MKRSLRQNLCVLAALLLGTSLLITDYVDARGGGGGGSRGGGGGSRGGGGASPRVNRSSDLQNRGNFSNRSQPSRDFSGRQGERQTSQQNRQGERSARLLRELITLIKLCFPRTDGNGWNIPKMHALAKMPHNMLKFGSASPIICSSLVVRTISVDK